MPRRDAVSLQHGGREAHGVAEHAQWVRALRIDVGRQQLVELGQHHRPRVGNHSLGIGDEFCRPPGAGSHGNVEHTATQPSGQYGVHGVGQLPHIRIHAVILTRLDAVPKGAVRTLGRMHWRRRTKTVWALAVAAGGLAACSSSAASPPTAPPPSLEITSTSVAPRVDDGVLQIGVLLPSSGAGAAIGQSARAAIRVAVDLANQHGGVNGHPVQTYFRDEGADAVTASIGLDQLLANQVDVIIGPGSSNTTVALLPKIVQAGVAACSPSASALELDTFPDRGLFFRTIPSDSLQAEAIAKVIEQTGDTLSLIHISEPTRPY